MDKRSPSRRHAVQTASRLRSPVDQVLAALVRRLAILMAEHDYRAQNSEHEHPKGGQDD